MTSATFDQPRRKFIGTSMAVASGAAVAGGGLLACAAHAQTAAGRGRAQ